MRTHQSESVKVLIRCRPMNSKEILSHSTKCIEILHSNQKSNRSTIKLFSPKKNRRRISRLFRFDSIYDENHRTEEIFDDFIQPLVDDVVSCGYSGTVFAYGQTGSGKSWTMTGCPRRSEYGLIWNAIESVFSLVSEKSSRFDRNDDLREEFHIQCAYLEIYNEELHDLLLPRSTVKSHSHLSRLELRENPRASGVHITNLTWKNVFSVEQCLKYKRQGDLSRTMGSTQMNRDSSRSHTMFSLAIRCRQRNQTKFIRQGKLNFVDLAGSERQLKTGASGQQLLESAKINLSLSALNKVISSLVQTNTTHIPYRDSKLTRLLQDSIGGTTKTIMIACISPSEENYDETLCTLRYASRTKNIRNTPIINENSSYVLLQQYAQEIQRLRSLLNSSNKQIQPASRSMIFNEIRSDDQHSLKVTCEHHLSTDSTTFTKSCLRTVSCQTMPSAPDRVFCSTQTTNDRKQIIFFSDDGQYSYQLLASHCCKSWTEEKHISLTLLVQEMNEDRYPWLGTLTALMDNQRLLWINHLHRRQSQLCLSLQTDSIITQFDCRQKIEDNSSPSTFSIILYSSSGSIVSFDDISWPSDKHSSILNNLITIKESNNKIYYLSDLNYSSNDRIGFVFHLDSSNLYHVHHLKLKDEYSQTDHEQIFESIHCEHCTHCCSIDENKSVQRQIISCSQFLSLIHMSCEREMEDTIDQSYLQIISINDQHRLLWTNRTENNRLFYDI